MRIARFMLLGLLVLIVAAWLVSFGVFKHLANRRLASLEGMLGTATFGAVAAEVRVEDPRENAAPLVAAAGALLPETEAADLVERYGRGEELSPEEEALARRTLADYALGFELLETAASRPRWDANLNWEQGIAIPMPLLAQVREEARLLCARARIEARDGDGTAALRDVATTIKLAKLLEQEPVLITQLVRIAALSPAVEPLEEALSTHEGYPGDLRDIIEALDTDAHRQALRRTLRTEMACIRQFVDTPRAAAGEATPFPRHGTVLLRPLAHATVAEGAASLGFFAELFAKPHYKAVPYEAPRPSLPVLWRFSSMIMPALEKCYETGEQCAAQMEAMRAAAAVALYEAEQGRLPASLAELVPDHLPAVPTDPFTGNPLVYKVEDGGFVVYSVGPDLTDDGGAPLDRETRGGDIAVRVER